MAHVVLGDSAVMIGAYEPNTFDSMITDPPAGICFMGKKWDHHKGGRDEWINWLHGIMVEALLVLKPGAHGLVWALPRTSHWTATALEDAGFEVRDIFTHLFGTGFPKSMDVGKAIDKELGRKRKVVGSSSSGKNRQVLNAARYPDSFGGDFDVTAPASLEAKQWEGYGTALKPASEHWILVRKPLEGTVAENVLEHGCGGLNIDGCRIGTNEQLQGGSRRLGDGIKYGECFPTTEYSQSPSGRFPANLVLSHSPKCKEKKCVPDCPVRLLDEQSGLLKSGKLKGDAYKDGNRDNESLFAGGGSFLHKGYSADQGGASRFFYCAKPSKAERGRFNDHPTVKSIELCRYFARLITPPGGLILDPFAGSASIGCAAVLEGFDYVGIEADEDIHELASQRLAEYVKKAERPIVKRVRRVVP
jgi:site-specific DNA-methyltransferase (adenine-specific)